MAQFQRNRRAQSLFEARACPGAAVPWRGPVVATRLPAHPHRPDAGFDAGFDAEFDAEFDEKTEVAA